MNFFNSIRDNLDWLLMAAIAVVILLPKFDLFVIAGTTTSIRVEDFVIATVYLIWLVWVMFKRGLHLTRAHQIMALVVIAGTISTAIGIYSGQVKSSDLGILNILRRIEYFGMFWVAYTWLKPMRLKLYLHIFVLISVVVIIIGILQFFALVPMFSTWQGYSGKMLYFEQNFGFLISTFAGHYDLGGYLILMTPLSLAMVFMYKQWKVKLLMCAVLLGYYFLLYYSFSRAAYGAIMLELILFLVLAKHYWLSLLPILDIGRVIWLYLGGNYSRYSYDIGIIKTSPTPTLILDATKSASPLTPISTVAATPRSTLYNTLNIGKDTAITLDPGGATRVDVWRNAWEHFIQNPIFGTGYSSIGTGADNQYLRILGETGLIGLAFFGVLVGSILKKFYIAMRLMVDSTTRWFLLALISGIVGLLAQAVLIDIFDSSKVALLLWFLVGLGWLVAESKSRVVE